VDATTLYRGLTVFTARKKRLFAFSVSKKQLKNITASCGIFNPFNVYYTL
jgi:hypothetical protein